MLNTLLKVGAAIYVFQALAGTAFGIYYYQEVIDLILPVTAQLEGIR